MNWASALEQAKHLNCNKLSICTVISQASTWTATSWKQPTHPKKCYTHKKKWRELINYLNVNSNQSINGSTNAENHHRTDKSSRKTLHLTLYRGQGWLPELEARADEGYQSDDLQGTDTVLVIDHVDPLQIHRCKQKQRFVRFAVRPH